MGGQDGTNKEGLTEALEGVLGHCRSAFVFLAGEVAEIVDEKGDGVVADGKGKFPVVLPVEDDVGVEEGEVVAKGRTGLLDQLLACGSDGRFLDVDAMKSAVEASRDARGK